MTKAEIAIPIHCSFTSIAATETLVPNPRNPNKHPDEQIALLAKIIKHQGWRNPIVVSKRSGFIVKGHARLEAARINGFQTVPIDEQHYENEAMEWADMIADNKIAELAETDAELLKELTLELGEDFDFDLIGIPDFQFNSLDPQGDIEEHIGNLSEEFLIPPFSILDARQGYWQDRKRSWLGIGIKSEIGRAENLLKFSDSVNRAQAGEKPYRNSFRLMWPEGCPGEFSRIHQQLFEDLSTNPLPKKLRPLPKALKPLIEMVYRGEKPDVEYGSNVIDPPPKAKLDDGSVIVCFSGGKDSLAAALRLKKMDLRVVLCHMTGINKYARSIELKSAQALANALSMDLIIAPIKQQGTTAWMENPIRNNLILSAAVDYGLQVGIYKFALGDKKSRHFVPENREVGVSDAIEIVDASFHWFERAVGSIHPLRLLHCLKDNADIWKEIFSYKDWPDLLSIVRSCMTGVRYHKAHRNRIKEKYKLDLLPGRCGVCYKCASEWFFLRQFNKTEHNQEFEKYCRRVMHSGYIKYILGEGRKCSEQEAVQYFTGQGGAG